MNTFRSLLVAVFTVGAVASSRAQTVTPIPAPTIITSAPYTITKPGFYQLGADLTITASTGNIITIQASNVTLDFAGHYISGPSGTPGSQVNGVYASEAGNLTIQNGTIAFCFYGIELTGDGTANSLNINQRISKMLITYCYGIGVYLNNAQNSDVLDSRISFIGGGTDVDTSYGIFSVGSGLKFSNNEITNLTSTSGKTYGIYGPTSSFSIGNTISGAYYACIGEST